jgi:hypothetical protein
MHSGLDVERGHTAAAAACADAAAASFQGGSFCCVAFEPSMCHMKKGYASDLFKRVKAGTKNSAQEVNEELLDKATAEPHLCIRAANTLHGAEGAQSRVAHHLL